MAKGTYQLLFYLPKDTSIVVGKRGRFRFPRGHYVYTGSARNGLERRIERHLRKDKRHFWHIDYLLDHAAIERIFVFASEKFGECALNLRTLRRPGARIIMRKFGSSDCRCPAHLVFFDKKPTDRLMPEEPRWPAKSIS